MDFKKLMQTMQQIEEGNDAPVGECGGMPAIIQSDQPAEESLNMNLTINSKGADGIRELIDVLKGIGGDDHTHAPHDDAKLFGTDDSEKSIVIGDNFENSVDSDAGPNVFDVNALINQGDKKSREARKVNGGGNPQVHESLITNLSELYEEIKSRTLLSEMSPEEKQAAIDAYFAKGGDVTYGRTKKTKKDRMVKLLPGEDESGIRHSADAKAMPNRASRHDHVNVSSKQREITPDWEDKLQKLKAIGDEDRARKTAERDRIDRAAWDDQLPSLKKLQRLNRSLVK